MKLADMSVDLVDNMGSDLSVVNAARVSFAKESDWDYDIKHDGRFNERIHEKDQKLINYLAKHNHWSPFAHNSLTFRIKAPIFVARQLVKHQVGGVWNEVSRRYVDDEPEFYFPEVWRGKPIGNIKQGSEGEWHDTEINVAYEMIQDLVTTYKLMVRKGCAPEMARMILPQNMMTEWWWTGSLMFFARVCKQRLDPHAQEETRQVAQKINDNIPDEFKHSWRALMEN